MINKSIAYRISIYISLAVVTAFIAIITISYFFNRQFLIKDLESKALGMSSEIISMIDRQLVSTHEITSNISEQVIYYSLHDDADILVKKIMEKYPFLNAIRINISPAVPGIKHHNYYSFRENDSIRFIAQNETMFICPVEKKVLKEITNKNIPAWSGPAKCPRNKNVVVSFYSPILSKEKPQIKIGEVISELSLLDLNDSINNFKIGKRGFAFLVSADGTYLTHPNKDWILTQNIHNLSHKVYDISKIDVDSVLNSRVGGTLVAHAELLNFEKSKIYHAPVAESGWQLIMVMPYNELYTPLYISMLRMLFFAVLGVLVIYLLVTYITNKQIQPLSKATNQLKRFSSLSGAEDLNTLNEVKLVSESLDYIRDWYQKYRISETQQKNRSFREKQDLLEASEIQRSLIKTDFSEFSKHSNIDLFATYQPAKVVSGDLYDYFFLDSKHLAFTVGDVSGKGVPAAIFMSIAQTIIKGNASLKRPRNIVRRVNDELCINNSNQFFLTLFVGILDIETGILQYCNAAHTTTYILKPNKEIIELTESHGLPLGLYPDKKYKDASVTLEKGDTIIVSTDGVYDLLNEQNEQFGEKRFAETLKKGIGYPPKQQIALINKAFQTFKGRAQQVDDICVMSLNFH